MSDQRPHDAPGRSWVSIDFPSSPLEGEGPSQPAALTLAEGLASGIDESRSLSGGFETQVLEKVRFRNGVQAIRKVSFEPMNADAEFLVSLVGLAIGAPVPHVLKTDEREVYMEVMPGRPAVTVLPDSSSEATEPYTHTPGGLLLAVLDSVTANNDRHAGNWLITEDRGVAGIDHGDVDLGIGIPDGSGMILPGEDIAESVFAKYWFIQEESHSAGWKENPLHVDDVRFLVNAVMPLEDEVIERGYDEWWLAMLGRFEAIEYHAKGLAPCLATMKSTWETPPKRPRVSDSQRRTGRSRPSSTSQRRAR